MELWFPTFRRLANREVPLPAIWRSATARQRNSLLRLIAVSIEQNAPLVPLLENWAEDERGYQRVRLRKLAAVLKSGRSLPEAIEEVSGVLRDEDVLAIRFDAQMGTRTAAVRQLLDRDDLNSPNPTHQVRGDLIYVASVTGAALLVIPFLYLKIVPVYQKMMQEFSTPVPAAFVWSLQAARIFVSFWWVLALACLVLGWCIISTKAGRFIRHSVFDRWFRSLRELHAADVLRKLEIATTAGRPIPGALSTLARYYFAPQIRHKLLFVRNEVEQGANVWQSMAAVDLISPPEMRLPQHNGSRRLSRLGARSTSRDQNEPHATTFLHYRPMGAAGADFVARARRPVASTDDLSTARSHDRGLAMKRLPSNSSSWTQRTRLAVHRGTSSLEVIMAFTLLTSVLTFSTPLIVPPSAACRRPARVSSRPRRSHKPTRSAFNATARTDFLPPSSTCSHPIF